MPCALLRHMQVVWKATTQVGCGLACNIVTCRQALLQRDVQLGLLAGCTFSPAGTYLHVRRAPPQPTSPQPCPPHSLLAVTTRQGMWRASL